MANFLNRMASRALGLVAVAQPVVPALYTPAFGLGQSLPPRDVGLMSHGSEVGVVGDSLTTTALEPPRDATLPREWQASDFTMAVEDGSSTPPSESMLGEERASTTIHPHRLSLMTRGAPAVQPALSPGPVSAVPDPHGDRAGGADALDRRATSANKSDEKVADGHRFSAGESLIAPQVVPARRPNTQPFPSGPASTGRDWGSASRRDHGASASAEPPVIRVTIGHIDVRAQFPAAAPSRAPARHARPSALTLDEYVRQRGEGKR